MTETWRQIPTYAGRYEASDQGRIRSTFNGRIRLLNPWVNKGRGYLYVSVHGASGGRRVISVHRLVLMAFVGELPNGLVSRHLDGDPMNNRLSNLRYGTYSENEQDKVRHGGNRNAAKVECIHGHKFTPDNTEKNGPNGGRRCKTCRRRTQREYESRRAAAASR